MAVIKAVHSKASIGNAIKYVTKEEKTENKLITGKDCDPFHAIEDMNATKELWGKKGGRQYDHYVQSFHENEKVTPEQAHEIACKWAEKEFKGHECLISTHVDKGHIHSHFIVNTVNFENGKKLHTSADWLEKAKAHSDELCREYGLTITEKGKTFEGHARTDMTSWSKDKYNLLEKADQGKVKSYVHDTAIAVMDSKEKAVSRDDFILKMAEKGYQTEWTDRKKHITFTDPEGHKVRASNLEKTFHIPFGKEELEREFEKNTRTAEPEDIQVYQFKINIKNVEDSLKESYAERDKLNKQISKREQKIDELKGFFNRKERAEVQEQLDTLKTRKEKLAKVIEVKEDKLIGLKAGLDSRLEELEYRKELDMARKRGESEQNLERTQHQKVQEFEKQMFGNSLGIKARPKENNDMLKPKEKTKAIEKEFSGNKQHDLGNPIEKSNKAKEKDIKAKGKTR